MKTRRYWIGLCAILLGIAGAVMLCRSCESGKREIQVKTDTVTVHDTVTLVRPAPKDSAVIRREVVRLPLWRMRRDTVIVRDSTRGADSVEVEVPVSGYHFKGERWELWMHGYRAGVDSLKLDLPTTTITRSVSEKRHSIGFGLQAGYGMTPRGLQPYVGVGVSWRF